jgi:transcriptional regulator with XRE-family HTH domain
VVARRLGLSTKEVLEQEENGDLSLSTLYAWRDVLDVPIAELLVEDGMALSAPVMKRAQLLRTMKTVKSILERARQVSIRRLAQFLVKQLVEMMPELAEVGPWPLVGSPRSTKELGQAFLRRFTQASIADRGQDAE